MIKEHISKQNESDANVIASKVMIITFAMLTLSYILNLVGVFIVPNKVMTAYYIGGGISLLLPVLIHRFIGSSHWILKYLYVTFAGIFIFAVSSTITFHSVVLYAFPVAVAGIYFNRKLTIYATVLTEFMTISAQVTAFAVNSLPDKNFPTWPEQILFSILPRSLILLCFSFLLLLLTRRTTKLLSEQVQDSRKILELHQDMIFGFATLVENRDENTGGHVKRTSRYAEMLADEMAKRNLYEELIDEEFVRNLAMAAPMHDIGKIAVPDNILQKTDKLTPEEYEIMKTHTIRGGQIIHETFSHVGNEQYRQMAYNVARYHHEKWNGTGYPDKLIGDDIPLSARIMAVADVFDALSQKRCYREAMPLEECFNIIKKGRGKDFDPVIVDVFIDIREKVEEEIYNS